ncbi:hypothetical protein Taro_026180 [Colocasia esculenta]|uniref:Uncharacterized protein n=1 Tax=Colocasia esculenta TaxID=4460 RepID=A0A843VEH9_COLES|nr:hypothetical protein [Colocasia esculenta]
MGCGIWGPKERPCVWFWAQHRHEPGVIWRIQLRVTDQCIPRRSWYSRISGLESRLTDSMETRLAQMQMQVTDALQAQLSQSLSQVISQAFSQINIPPP